MPFLTLFFVGRFGSPSKIDYRKRNRYPYSNLSNLEDLVHVKRGYPAGFEFSPEDRASAGAAGQAHGPADAGPGPDQVQGGAGLWGLWGVGPLGAGSDFFLRRGLSTSPSAGVGERGGGIWGISISSFGEGTPAL